MNLDYVGNELDLFANAKNWKNYWFSKIEPFLGNSILEVGAGIGANAIKILASNQGCGRLECIEPDEKLAEQILPNITKAGLSTERVQVSSKFLSEADASVQYDSILYIDVIEHIENDKAEVKLATRFLKPGGALIILVPAHNFLFSPFDKSIGHYRRYNKKMLKTIVPSSLKIESLRYLDSIGMAASVSNKLLLKQSYPTISQILLWDNYIVSLSKLTDKLLNYQIGKSLLMVCRKY